VVGEIRLPCEKDRGRVGAKLCYWLPWVGDGLSVSPKDTASLVPSVATMLEDGGTFKRWSLVGGG
jgi:hypothetical protein